MDDGQPQEVTTKWKGELWGIKAMDEKDDVKQLTLYYRKFLKYNPMKTNVEKVYNIYL